MRKNPAWREGFLAFAYGVVRVIGAGIFLYLTYYSLRYSQYMFPGTREFPIDMKDNPAYNILAAGVLFAAVFGLLHLEKKLTERCKLWTERAFLCVSLLWTASCCFWWISALDRQPVADQAFIYGGASYFLEGQYSFLGHGGYCEMYPHQLGLIAFVELLFLVFGPYNYFAYQLMCAGMAVGIVFLGYGLLKEQTDIYAIRIVYCLLMMGCVPMICYTSWVYGEVPSVFFSMLAAWFAVKWENSQSKGWLAGVAAACVMAVMVRKNSMILLIALCLLAALHIICYCRWQIGLTALLTVLCSFLAYQGIYKMYEHRSGYEHHEGLPVNSWIAMGMMEQEGRCGWYNNLGKDVLYSLELDYKATEKVMDAYIEERIETFENNPAYSRWFFKRKILSQWNEPLYQSIYFSAENLGNHSPESGSFLEKLYFTPEVHDRIFDFADIIQFLVYMGMLFYYLFAIRRDTPPLACLLAVTVIGGFFFSILWEAKARYIFPYYVMMYPLAAAGYFGAAQQIRDVWEKILRRMNIAERLTGRRH